MVNTQSLCKLGLLAYVLLGQRMFSAQETVSVRGSLPDLTQVSAGCEHVPTGETCLTYKQVAATVPEVFRPLWEGGITDVGIVRAGFPCASISMNRSGGLLFLPGHTYEMTFFRDGRAVLKSRDQPEKDTEYSGTVAVWDYGKLCYFADRLSFDRFAQHYSANWTDDAGIQVTIESRGRVVSVSEYGGIGPVELWAIERAIEAVKQRIEWKLK
jgi:hypothetical protein